MSNYIYARHRPEKHSSLAYKKTYHKDIKE